MPGTMLADPNRFTQAQRMAQAFAQSELVPKHMQGSMPNCLVALMLADEMGEHPLMVMQNLVMINGRPGWMAQYMISRANRSEKFYGPLRWRTEGNGDDLAVTCFASLRAFKDDPDRGHVEVTVTMEMARKDGWTRNEKYKSIPEQMLRWRSASWLVRLYSPEVMFGMPTVDELEDTMKDVTPPRPTMDTYKPGETLRDQLRASVDATETPEAEPASAPPEDAGGADSPPTPTAPPASNSRREHRVPVGEGITVTAQDTPQTIHVEGAPIPFALTPPPADAARSPEMIRLLEGLATETTRAGVDAFLRNNARDIAALTLPEQRDFNMRAVDHEERLAPRQGNGAGAG